MNKLVSYCPCRLEAEDLSLSRRKRGFEFPRGYSYQVQLRNYVIEPESTTLVVELLFLIIKKALKLKKCL